MNFEAIMPGSDFTTPSDYDKLDYEYPNNWDLSPGSEMHQKIVSEILKRTRSSRSVMMQRYSSWDKIDKNLNGYIPLSEEEKAIKSIDDRRPMSVVVPATFAVLETLLTYMMNAFLTDTYFSYEGVGPEDTVGAILLSHHVQQQMLRGKAELALHTQWRDSLCYGIGVLAPRWNVEYGTRSSWETSGIYDLDGTFIPTGESRVESEQLVWEGNVLDNIEVRNFLPDPHTPIQNLQRAEFVSWVTKDSEISLLEREASGADGLFNCRYLRRYRGMSEQYYSESGRGVRDGVPQNPIVDGTNPVDTIWQYVNLVPKQWGFGDSEYPEKWLFALANGKVIIKADRMKLNHNKFPVVVCAPDFDGYSVCPVSRLEIIYGLQQAADWFYSTYFAEVRKTLHGMFVVDPYIINVDDIKAPAPGKIIRTRRSTWGQGVGQGIEQLRIDNVTQDHVNLVNHISELIHRVTGATDALQGIMQENAPERRTAEEYRGAKESALSRLSKAARLIGIMSMRDLGYMLASHTIQLQSQQTYVRLSGEWEQRLISEYGVMDIQNSRMQVSPRMLSVDYDIQVKDGGLSDHSNAKDMMDMIGIVTSNQELMMNMDTTRMFLSLARRMGEKNATDWVRKQPLVPQVMPDQQVEEQVQAGNLR